MATLCVKAETLLKEKNIQLSAQKRYVLSTYDDDTQVRWIVNPMIEWLLQQCTNRIICQNLEGSTQNLQASNPVNKTTVQPLPQPQPQPQPEPEPQPDTNEDAEQDIFMGLFD